MILKMFTVMSKSVYFIYTFLFTTESKLYEISNFCMSPDCMKRFYDKKLFFIAQILNCELCSIVNF